jgi:glutaconyl-CoA decarboxylase
LKAPLPGTILDISVSEGDTVKIGQQLMVLEAMKMENCIQAEQGGVVEKIFRQKGDSVLESDVILLIK